MKIQDILFFAVFGVLLIVHKPILFVWFGLVSLLFSIPLFAGWVFFTAERLTWYAAAFFVIFLLISLLSPRKVQ